MTTHASGNYCHGKAVTHLASGDTITGGNYSQLVPDTDVFTKLDNITVTGGNFCNCRKPATWTVEGGNWGQVSRCSHEHPEWVAKGLPVCAEDCEHRLGDEKVWVDTAEEEYRTEKNSLSAEAAPVKVTNTTDADGIVSQKLEKQVFVYTDKVVAKIAENK